MKLRSKLSLGIGILFTLILIQGIQSIRYVRHLSVSSKEILSDNYNSVHYVSEMLRSLDRFSQDSASRRTLIEALTLQQQNITEINERPRGEGRPAQRFHFRRRGPTNTQ